MSHTVQGTSNKAMKKIDKIQVFMEYKGTSNLQIWLFWLVFKKSIYLYYNKEVLTLLKNKQRAYTWHRNLEQVASTYLAQAYPFILHMT